MRDLSSSRSAEIRGEVKTAGGDAWCKEMRGRAKHKLSEPQLWLVSYLHEKFPHAQICPEHQFHNHRKWRFDVALIEYATGERWAFEVEGGIFSNGAHVRGKHFLSDAEKYNTAAALGWKVFRFTPEQILKGEAKQFIEESL